MFHCILDKGYVFKEEKSGDREEGKEEEEVMAIFMLHAVQEILAPFSTWIHLQSQALRSLTFFFFFYIE